MAVKTSGTALQKALRGEKVTERQAQGALSQAVDRITSLTKRTDKAKEAITVTGGMVIHSAETQGTLFLASMAEGFFGKQKLELGGVDVRAPLAIVTQGYGIYEAMTGKRGGGHALALGNGMMGSWLASVGIAAGQTLREKRNAPAQVAQQPAATVTPTMQGTAELLSLPAPSLIPEPTLRGPMREVLLTPEASDDEQDFEGRGSRHRKGRRPRPRHAREAGGGRFPKKRPSRFIRAERDESELDDE